MAYFCIGILSYVPYLWMGPFRADVPLFLLCVGLNLGFLVAAYRGAGKGYLSLRWFLLTCLALRLLLMVQPPHLSEDVFRYLWDGMLTAQGRSPYPDAPEQLVDMQAAHGEIYSGMAHRDRTTIYPPGAQFFFWISYLVWGNSVTGWKCLLLLAEIGLLWMVLAGWKVPYRLVVPWALNPLVILEFYSSGHLDLLAIVCLVASLYCIHPGRSTDRPTPDPRPLLSAVFLAAAILIKLVPIVVAPLLILHQRGSRQRWHYGLVVVACCVAATALWLLFLGDPVRSARSFLNIVATFHHHWRFNSLPYFVLDAYRVEAQWVLESLFLMVLAALSFKEGDRSLQDLAGRCYFVLLFLYLCTPTIHPWYVSWLLAVYPVLGPRYWAGLYLGGAVLLSYTAYGFQPPGERLWVLLMEYVPLYGLTLRDVAICWRRAANGRVSWPPFPSRRWL